MNKRVGINVVVGFCEAFGDFHYVVPVTILVDVHMKADILEIHVSRVTGFSHRSYLVCQASI